MKNPAINDVDLFPARKLSFVWLALSSPCCGRSSGESRATHTGFRLYTRKNQPQREIKKGEIMKNTKLVLPAILALLIFTVSAHGAGLKIGYVNLQKVLDESAAGMEASAALEEEMEKLEASLNEKQLELKKLKEEIDKKGRVWNKETLEAKEQNLMDMSQDFQQQFLESNKKWRESEMKKKAEILKEISDLVEEIAQKKGYSYVFEKSMGGLLYALPEADLTDTVIKLHNKRYRTRSR